jgi:hypothetical protein
MKPTSTPHDPLDELLAAAVHGELTAAQRAELDALLQNDPAARAAYQEIQAMHDLLERNHHDAKPDPAFEDRMISGVRRKARAEVTHRETPWESVLVLWRAVQYPFVARQRRVLINALAVIALAAVLAGVAMGPITNGIRKPGTSFEKPRLGNTEVAYSSGKFEPPPQEDLKLTYVPAQPISSTTTAAQPLIKTQAGDREDYSPSGTAGRSVLHDLTLDEMSRRQNALKQGFDSGHPDVGGVASDALSAPKNAPAESDATDVANSYGTPVPTTPAAIDATTAPSRVEPAATAAPPAAPSAPTQAQQRDLRKVIKDQGIDYVETAKKGITLDGYVDTNYTQQFAGKPEQGKSTPTAKPAATPEITRKLIRDAQLDLEVKSYQNAVDAITTLAHTGGGYVDSSNSQRGGNGKLQGTVVVKVLPENLDAFLLKLRPLGDIKNQSVSTQDVTKDYYDTQARLNNSGRMEAQLQQLLAHTNGKVSDLLQVERELERVRGQIEQMQGQLKLYDFQVQYATVTIAVAEKDLNKAAAYLLQEHDQFSLFVPNVEDSFTQAKAAADTFKAQILNANLQHDSGNNIGATMAFSVPPDQIDGFLDRVKSLGRVDNFTRTTQRVANDGGDSSQPADQTRTEKDAVQVQLSIRADDESPRQQTQLAVASTGDIDAQAQQLKDDAVKAGAAVVASNFQRAPDGTETATISFRLALAKVADQMAVLEKLGRVESLTVQRNDRPGQAAADPSAPAEIDLTLHNVPAIRFEDEQPRQATQLAISSSGDVDAQALQVKSDALKAGMAVTASTFQREPDGMEQAAMTFRLPMTQAANFTATLEKLGKVESLAVQRNDVAGPNSTDPNAPAEISLTLHNEPAVVAENRGFWATLRHTFGGGIEAFFASVQVIGVLVAFIAPWVVALGITAWIGRRIYVARKARKTA